MDYYKKSSEHQNLREYLESRGIFPPFVVDKDPKMREKYEKYSAIQLIAQILWTTRYFYFLGNSPNDPLNYYLADANYMLGPARVAMNLVFALLNTCSIIAVVYTKYSPYLEPGAHLYWLRACEVFETGYFRGIEKFYKELRLLYLLKYPFIFTILGICIFACINYFIQTPLEYVFFGIFFLFYHIFDAWIVLFYLANRQALFTFHMYLHAKFFAHQSDCITNGCKDQSTILMEYFASNRELQGLYRYYDRCFCLMLLIFFVAQVYLCYYIFFVDIDVSVRISLVVALISSHSSGVSGSFLIGAYLQNKVCMKRPLSLGYFIYQKFIILCTAQQAHAEIFHLGHQIRTSTREIECSHHD